MPSAPRAPNVGSVTSASTELADAHVLQLKLRLASDPETGDYRVTIELSEVCVTVEVKDADLRRAASTAAEQCAERLRERGFTVTATEVLGALEDALDNSELVRVSAGHLN
jgi:hypothetical protein